MYYTIHFCAHFESRKFQTYCFFHTDSSYSGFSGFSERETALISGFSKIKKLFSKLFKTEGRAGFSILENSIWVLVSRNPEPDEYSYFYELGNSQRLSSVETKNMSKHSSAFETAHKGIVRYAPLPWAIESNERGTLTLLWSSLDVSTKIDGSSGSKFLLSRSDSTFLFLLLDHC